MTLHNRKMQNQSQTLKKKKDNIVRFESWLNVPNFRPYFEGIKIVKDFLIFYFIHQNSIFVAFLIHTF